MLQDVPIFFSSNQNVSLMVAKVAQSASHKTTVLWMTVNISRDFSKFMTAAKEVSEGNIRLHLLLLTMWTIGNKTWLIYFSYFPFRLSQRFRTVKMSLENFATELTNSPGNDITLTRRQFAAKRLKDTWKYFTSGRTSIFQTTPWTTTKVMVTKMTEKNRTRLIEARGFSR